MLRRIGKSSRELDTAAGIFGVQSVRVLNGEVGVEQLVGVFVGIRRGRLGAAEIDSVLVARDDCTHWGSSWEVAKGLPIADRLLSGQWWAHLAGALRVHPHKYDANFPLQEVRDRQC